MQKIRNVYCYYFFVLRLRPRGGGSAGPLLLLPAAANAAGVVELTPANFDSVMRSGRVFVEMCAPPAPLPPLHVASKG